MFNSKYIKQVGILNFFFRNLILKFIIFSKNYHSYKTTTGNKYKINKWDPSAAEVFITKCFTDWGNEYLFLDSLKEKKNNLFIDVGCHTGYYPILFYQYFSRIIGFEPNSKCIHELDNLENEKFACYRHYVGSTEKSLLSIDSKDGYSFESKNVKLKDRQIINQKELKQITLDNYCANNNLTNISAIKIDVDGMDFEVLKGSEKTIEINRPSIMIENYSSKLIEFFKDKNYSLLSLSALKNRPYCLKLEELDSYDKSKWIKMVCCIPEENKKNYNEKLFNGNIFTGINKKKILNTFFLNK